MALNFVGQLPTDEVQSRSQHKGLAAELAENPGQWAQISPEGGYGKRASATSTASDINKGKNNAYKADEDGKFEAVARTVEGENHVYARYNSAKTVTSAPVAASQAETDTEDDAPAFSG